MDFAEPLRRRAAACPGWVLVEADACPGWCIDGSHRCPARGFGDQRRCRVRPVAAEQLRLTFREV